MAEKNSRNSSIIDSLACTDGVLDHLDRTWPQTPVDDRKAHVTGATVTLLTPPAAPSPLSDRAYKTPQ
jgi:hypothetical protein